MESKEEKRPFAINQFNSFLWGKKNQKDAAAKMGN